MHHEINAVNVLVQCNYQLFVYTGSDNELHGDSLDLSEQHRIARIPKQPTSDNSGMIDVWLPGFAKGLICCADAGIPTYNTNIIHASCGL